MSALDFALSLFELEARFSWPAVPRTNYKMFFAYIYGTSDLGCQGGKASQRMKVYVPETGTGNAFTKPSNGRLYTMCSFMNEINTSSGKRCGYECHCKITYCEAVYVKVPDSHTPLCEVEFSDVAIA